MFHMMMKRRYALLDLYGKDQLDYNLGLQLRLRGEVHRVVAARDQKYQSNFVEVCKSPRLCPLFALGQPYGSLLVPELQDYIPSLCRPLLLRVCRCKR
jgi:hypothetical protein